MTDYEPLYESPGWHTFFIIALIVLAMLEVQTVDYAWTLVDEAREKEARPLRTALEYNRAEKHRLNGVLLACLSGKSIMLRDGATVHYSDCVDYAVTTIGYLSEVEGQ